MLDEVHGELGEVGQVEPVEPDHGAFAVLAVVVPVPCRRQDDVATLHGDALAMHGRESPAAFDDEAHGEGGVPVRGGGFIGHDQLQARVEGVGCERGFWHVLALLILCSSVKVQIDGEQDERRRGRRRGRRRIRIRRRSK